MINRLSEFQVTENAGSVILLQKIAQIVWIVQSLPQILLLQMTFKIRKSC